MLIYRDARSVLPRVANLETHFAIFASLRIIKFRLFLPNARRPGRPEIRLAAGQDYCSIALVYFTRSLITINIRLSAPSFVTAVCFPVPAERPVTRPAN